MTEHQKPAKLAVAANNGNAQWDNELLARTSPAFRALYDFIQKTNQAGEQITTKLLTEVKRP